jgi:putative peptidoglycan lipid II flippase
LPRLLGIDAHWGAAGLTASAGIAGWIEFLLLRSRMNRRIGATGLPPRFIASLWAAAIVGIAAGWGMRALATHQAPFVARVLVLAAYGAIYLVTTVALGVPEARRAIARLRRR